MPRLALSPQVFAILSALIEERLGIYFGADDRELLGQKLEPRVLECGFESMLDYYYFLRYDAAADAELVALADAITVNETYFLREVQQLRVLVETFLRPRASEGRRLRVWSAACSTGEEPITLAAILREQGLLEQVEIVATDVSSRVLRIASEGRYGARALRSGSIPEWLQRDGQHYVPEPSLREHIDWRRVNLLDGEAVLALGTFDAVICRNVLIYFRDEPTQRIIGLIHGRLADDGLLLVGASESLMRFGTGFSCEERQGSFFYRKVSN